MPAILIQRARTWQRQVLPTPPAYALIRTEDVLLGQGEPAEIAPTALGLLLLTGEGEAYHLPAAQLCYHNAERAAENCLRRLAYRDRITYHGSGEIIRLWFLQNGGGFQGPAERACGYCSGPLEKGEGYFVCVCGELLHADCLQHAGGSCPRCGSRAALEDAAWLPEGFQEDEEAGDDDG